MTRKRHSSRSLEQALQDKIKGEVRFDPVSRAIYSTDASVFEIIPEGVVIPKCPDDIINTVKICRDQGVSITARGGGTSQAGQAVGQGVQLDYSKYLNRIIQLDVQDRIIEVEPGKEELGFVGIPNNINVNLIESALYNNQIPIIAPLGLGKNNQTFIINGDTAASAIAKKLKSRRLILMTNVEGVYDDQKKLISEIINF